MIFKFLVSSGAVFEATSKIRTVSGHSFQTHFSVLPQLSSPSSLPLTTLLYPQNPLFLSVSVMFDFFFGWRKASKCKRLVKRVQRRLKLLKNKRSSIARLVRGDMAQLILAGHEEIAFNRAEQLCNNMSLLSAYELLDQFCEFILGHLSYIRKHKDLPDDINEAVSSLIFASSRFGDIPELTRIRKLFAERYGNRFATAAVDLFPGNLVNTQIIEKLSLKSVPEVAKLNLFDEIARGCSLDTDVLTFEFASEMQRQEKEDSKNQVLDMYLLTYYNEIKGYQIQDSITNSDMTVNSVGSSMPPRSSRDTSESPSYNEEEVNNSARLSPPYMSTVTDLVAQEAAPACAIDSASSSESPDQCHDEDLIYLDDIEEFESPKAKDQRLFVFKISKSNNENVEQAKTLKQRTRHDHVAAVYDVFACPDMRGKSKDLCSNPRKTSYRTREEIVEPPCRRAVTMPQERHKEGLGGNIERFNSCPYKHPRHVHPKLPDYDDIAAKFMALRLSRRIGARTE